jgi:TRAP-type C4-dicarboxylate transport system permease small subunit
VSTHVHTCAADTPLEDELAAAFRDALAVGVDALVVVFPPDAKLTRELVPGIVTLARTAPALTALALVHTSPTLSFIASSLALQLPGIRVRSAASPETAGI